MTTPPTALQNIPGWENSRTTPLHGGLNNKSYKVTAAGRSGVLKIDDAPRNVPFNTRLAEAKVQSAAADAGLAARVLYSDERVYFVEYLEGDVWTPHYFDKNDNLETLAAGLRRLHSLPLTGRTFDALGAAKGYAGASRNASRELTDFCVTTVANTRGQDTLCCCHNDLVAENMLYTPELKFLDWEYACDNDPLFDLATVVEHHEFSVEQTATLLNAYFAGEADAWLSDLNKQRKQYLALLWLWMASRPDTDLRSLEHVAMRLNMARHD